jgi:hypothetical protein
LVLQVRGLPQRLALVLVPAWSRSGEERRGEERRGGERRGEE